MKKKNNLVAAVAAIIMVGAFGYPAYQMATPEEAQITLIAPKECRVGELVTFDASDSDMDNIAWSIFPPTTNFKIINEGKQAIFSAEQPGNFTVTVAVSNDKKVALTVTHLVVLGSDSLIPDIINVINSPVIPFSLKPQFEVPPLQPDEKEPQTLDIRSWSPQKPESNRISKMIKSLTDLVNMMEKDNFETKDEMVQATAWTMDRATQKDETWKPFIINFIKYLEGATSKSDCISRVNQVLQSLMKLQNATT